MGKIIHYNNTIGTGEYNSFVSLCGLSHIAYETHLKSAVTCSECLALLHPNLPKKDAVTVNDQPTNADIMRKLDLIEQALRENMYTLLNVLNKLNEP